MSKIYGVAFDSAGQLLASGNADDTAKLWHVATGNLLRTFEGHKSAVSSVAFHPQGQILASGSDDNTVKLGGRGQRQTAAQP